jgi:hypothetical protein
MHKHTVTFFSFGVLLATIFGFNFNTSTILNQFVQEKYLAQTKLIEYNQPAALDEQHSSSQLEDLGITLHPGTDYAPESKSSPSSLNHCKAIVYKTLESLPSQPVKKLKSLTLYFSNDGRRGLGGGSTIILRCQNVTDMELVGVLVHEMGHIQDTGVMIGTSGAGKSEFKDGDTPIYKDDSSLGFYRLSFKSEKTLRSDATDLDFVSGYAKSDAFEDFAESYAYYILHGDEFRTLAYTNSTLAAKYDYLKNTVFDGKEYFNGDDKNVEVLDRHYDVTVLPYDLDKFFTI